MLGLTVAVPEIWDILEIDEKKLKKNVLAWGGFEPQIPGWEPAILSTRLQSSAN